MLALNSIKLKMPSERKDIVFITKMNSAHSGFLKKSFIDGKEKLEFKAYTCNSKSLISVDLDLVTHWVYTEDIGVASVPAKKVYIKPQSLWQKLKAKWM